MEKEFSFGELLHSFDFGKALIPAVLNSRKAGHAGVPLLCGLGEELDPSLRWDDE
ncbi:MAG: hypothetical protein J0I77_10215 [Rudaea sp.]|uniref:hypothetical protein n=1 Tax=unclassified Rudaea TaxID=2627037 RepID=UPI0014858DBB|nr:MULTISPECIES: hypothetical protein [unclassified Rudaea]MBN8886084.1 hypothetical protein [Rudaea sp.]